METVYVVYYDNGQHYEEHDISVQRVFASRESADNFVNEKTQKLIFTIESKEEYEKNLNRDEPHYSYEDYYEMQWQDWNYYCADARYYVREYAVHP